MARVSVIVTTHDRPAMLDQALSSVRAQTFGDIEILVCDDASPPSTAEVVAVHARADGRVKYLAESVRVGQPAVSGRGLGAASGELISFCNHDDAWEPAFLARMVEVMDARPEVVLAFSDHWIMDEVGRVDVDATEANTRRWRGDSLAPGLHRPFARMALVDQSLPLAMAVVFRSSQVARALPLPAEVGFVYDLWISYLLARTGAAAWYEPERLTRYRVHAGGAAARAGANADAEYRVEIARSFAYVWSAAAQDERLAGIAPELEAKLARSLTDLGVRLVRAGRPAEARSHLARALRLDPSARAVAGLGLAAVPMGAHGGRLLARARRRLGPARSR